ncbi:hypothetical protein M0812_26544 [Anaeramoeba flamelloides]|uniref:Uncharacterized protein n=1 Tax=Anaeramoeba flamelloides TaxID=1746091 RepID=A0AAV7YHM1_9EUKA|nr:hypothetical protein M0812_26544 [Anaeramoeba flamelloides]
MSNQNPYFPQNKVFYHSNVRSQTTVQPKKVSTYQQSYHNVAPDLEKNGELLILKSNLSSNEQEKKKILKMLNELQETKKQLDQRKGLQCFEQLRVLQKNVQGKTNRLQQTNQQYKNLKSDYQKLTSQDPFLTTRQILSSQSDKQKKPLLQRFGSFPNSLGSGFNIDQSQRKRKVSTKTKAKSIQQQHQQHQQQQKKTLQLQPKPNFLTRNKLNNSTPSKSQRINHLLQAQKKHRVNKEKSKFHHTNQKRPNNISTPSTTTTTKTKTKVMITTTNKNSTNKNIILSQKIETINCSKYLYKLINQCTQNIIRDLSSTNTNQEFVNLLFNFIFDNTFGKQQSLDLQLVTKYLNLLSRIIDYGVKQIQKQNQLYQKIIITVLQSIFDLSRETGAHFWSKSASGEDPQTPLITRVINYLIFFSANLNNSNSKCNHNRRNSKNDHKNSINNKGDGDDDDDDDDDDQVNKICGLLMSCILLFFQVNTFEDTGGVREDEIIQKNFFPLIQDKILENLLTSSSLQIRISTLKILIGIIKYEAIAQKIFQMRIHAVVKRPTNEKKTKKKKKREVGGQEITPQLIPIVMYISESACYKRKEMSTVIYLLREYSIRFLLLLITFHPKYIYQIFATLGDIEHLITLFKQTIELITIDDILKQTVFFAILKETTELFIIISSQNLNSFLSKMSFSIPLILNLTQRVIDRIQNNKLFSKIKHNRTVNELLTKMLRLHNIISTECPKYSLSLTLEKSSGSEGLEK